MHRINLSVVGLGSCSRYFHHGNGEGGRAVRASIKCSSITAKRKLAKIFAQFGKKLLDYNKLTILRQNCT